VNSFIAALTNIKQNISPDSSSRSSSPVLFIFFSLGCIIFLTCVSDNSRAAPNNTQAELHDDISRSKLIDNVDGKKLLQKYCSQCHAPPLAKKQTIKRWHSIILRMQRHRQQRGFKNMSKLDIRKLSQFLNQIANKQDTQ